MVDEEKAPGSIDLGLVLVVQRLSMCTFLFEEVSQDGCADGLGRTDRGD